MLKDFEDTCSCTRPAWGFLYLAAADRTCINTNYCTYFLFLMLYMDRVVCRMLGLTFGYVMSSNVPGKGMIWLDDVSCTGSERSLIDCNHRPWGSHNCDHSQDVGIVCGKEELGSNMRIMV